MGGGGGWLCKVTKFGKSGSGEGGEKVCHQVTKLGLLKHCVGGGADFCRKVSKPELVGICRDSALQRSLGRRDSVLSTTPPGRSRLCGCAIAFDCFCSTTKGANVKK